MEQVVNEAKNTRGCIIKKPSCLLMRFTGLIKDSRIICFRGGQHITLIGATHRIPILR